MIKDFYSEFTKNSWKLNDKTTAFGVWLSGKGFSRLLKALVYQLTTQSSHRLET